MDGWMDEWMDGWMDGWLSCVKFRSHLHRSRRHQTRCLQLQQQPIRVYKPVPWLGLQPPSGRSKCNHPLQSFQNTGSSASQNPPRFVDQRADEEAPRCGCGASWVAMCSNDSWSVGGGWGCSRWLV